MMWYQWFSVFGLLSCLVICSFHLIRLIRLGKPPDHSQKKGNIRRAVRYSFTGAMSPAKKESAFLHLPTYTAGILFHLGSFAGLALFIITLFGLSAGSPLDLFLVVFFLITATCGSAILIKRIVNYKLRALSNPDDFVSNALVTGFQLVTALMLTNPAVLPAYFVTAGILLFYLPLGKLKHTVYFFAARYHLGFFYGWRGVWPPQ